MGCWKQAIEAAYRTVYNIAWDGHGTRQVIDRKEALTAIRAIPEPPTLSEEELVKLVAEKIFDADDAFGMSPLEKEIAFPINLHDLRPFERERVFSAARAALSVVRSYDRREADGVHVDVARLTSERDEARRMYCKEVENHDLTNSSEHELFNQLYHHGLADRDPLWNPGKVHIRKAKQVAAELWPDSADMLFPEVK